MPPAPRRTGIGAVQPNGGHPTFTSWPFSLPPQLFKRGEIADDDKAFPQFEQPGALPYAQLLVYVFARGANDVAELLLRHGELKRWLCSIARAAVGCEPDQGLGEPAFEPLEQRGSRPVRQCAATAATVI